MKMLKRWISVCLVILLLAGVAFDHSSLIGSTVEAAGLEETDGAEPAETPDASEETTDVPSLLSEGDGADTPTPEEQAITNTETETEAPAEKTETKQEESTGPEKQAVTNSDTETKAPAEKTETKQEESAEPEKQTVTNSDTETKAPVESQTSTAAPATPEKKQEAMKLDQEIKDGNGTVVFKVTADIKEDTFDANTDEVTMKVSAVDKDLEDSIKKLMEKNLAADKELGSYFLYKVEFQVNGKTVEPGKEVKITFEPKDYKIDDVKDATVFYYNEANSPAGNKEAEIKEIIQKQEKIEALQKAGQSIENIDKDYDLTEITLKADKTAEKIVTEGRRSTVYGCYLEDELDSLTYENDEVTITVSETEIGAIPDEAALKVVPILEDDKDTEDQYKEVEEQIQKKAEEDEKDIKGFLAYDITFVDADGNEVEPNSEVKVTMEYKEPALPAWKTTMETKDTEVSVLHLEEDKDGNVKEVVDMNEAGQVDALETGNEQQVQKVEVRTESFSTFVITWNYNQWSSFTITAHYVYFDENGDVQEIPDSLVSQEDVRFDQNTNECDLTDYVVEPIPGYEYQNIIRVNNAENGPAVTKLRKTIQEWWLDTYYYIQYDNGTGEYTYWLSNDYKISGEIYYIYEETGVKIADNIIENGTLDAVYNGDVQVSKYEWYKSDSETGNYTLVEKVDYVGGASNISGDGKALYPAYDDGARQYYKVKVILEDGTSVESTPFQVPYYDALQNGGFENPTVLYSYNEQWSNEDYKSLNGVWQTTGEGTGAYNGRDIEIVREGIIGGADAYSWYGDWSDAAPEGSQFAELNCEAAGALYQDVLTIPGEPLNYSLDHRARGDNAYNLEYDTMFLVIMPTKDSQNLITQDQLEDELRTLGVNVNAYSDQNEENVVVYNQNGILVVRITSDDQDWHKISVPAGYTPTDSMTRFFFVAGSTASSRGGNERGNTVGNFLDDVWFSQELPQVADDEFSIQITKEFKGLDSTGISNVKNNIQFEISAEDANGRELNDQEVIAAFGVKCIEGKKMTSAVDQSLRFAIANHKIGVNDEYKVTITESNAELDGYNMSSEVQTSVRVGEDEAQVSEGATFTIKGKTIAEIEFTNTYNRSENKQVNFTKVWDDNGNEYQTRPESLEVTLVPTITVEKNGELVDKVLTSENLGGLALTKTITATDDWKTSWDVPVYYDYNEAKVKINYTVTEGDINSDYVYESASDGAQAGDGSDYEKQFDSSNITPPDSASDASTANSVSSIAGRVMYSAATYSADADEKSGETLGEPAHNKYVEYNKATGDYTLNLDVTGATGEANGVDILFVIDTSGSMGTGWGSQYNNLLPDVKKLLADDNGIIDQIFETEGNVNSVAYVSFAGKSETTTSRWYTGTNNDINTLKNNINSLKATGGTNWTYAMQKASSLLAQKSGSTNEKVVIFLSDGKPTYSMSGTRQTGNGNTTYEDYYEDAASVVSESSSLSQAQIYSVYLTSGTMEGMKKFSDKLKNSTLKDGTDLGTALEDILEVIIPAYSNVTIEDTLSEYVDFVDERIVVTKRSANGNVTTLTGNAYTAEISDKTIKVSINGTLDDGATYTVSFRVKPNDAANSYYAKHNGYPAGAVGEAGTGSTSAGKDGFYSNAEDTAKVTYKVNDEPGSADYPMPVVQVTTHTLTFEKEWKQPVNVESPTGDITLDVRYSDGTSSTITLRNSEGYRKTISVPVTKTISSVTETSQFANYTPSYQISADGTTATVINNYSKVEKQDITVQKKWIGDGPESDIEVGLYQSVNGGEAVLKDRITLRAPDWTYTWDDQNIAEYEGEDTAAKYTYAVREISTPAGYSSSISYEFETGKIVATITNTYDPNCESESYYIANVLQTEQLTVDKTWDDNDNTLGLRPKNLKVTVSDGAGGTYTVSLTEGNWQKTLTILKKKETNFTASENLNTTYYSQEGNASISSTGKGVLISFVNKLQSKDIIVQKVWKDGWTGDKVDNRPGSIKFTLYYKEPDVSDWTKYDTYSLTSENILYDGSGTTTNWAIKIPNLPINYKYKVEEKDVAVGYWSDVTEANNTFTITNTLKWSLKKTDMPESGDASVLKGAEFELKQNDQVVATGTSGEDGMVTWTGAKGSSFDQNNLNGSYILVETKAPDGYQKLTAAEWKLTFEDGVLTNASGEGGYNSYISISSKDKDNGAVVTLENDKLYELPSTGGPGIYWYLFGGVLLMMAASLIVYKNKRREVLKRK